MDQYRPCYNAHRFAEISRRPTQEEMSEAFRTAGEMGLTRLDERPYARPF